ncbi:hypothetical protein PybrP1_001170, partial [[Pythium] brassicae (nom. inval.)]
MASRKFTNPFPPLKLKREDAAQLEVVAQAVVRDTMEQFERFAFDRRYEVDESRWKFVLQRDNIRAFGERRGLPNEHLLPDEPVSDIKDLPAHKALIDGGGDDAAASAREADARAVGYSPSCPFCGKKASTLSALRTKARPTCKICFAQLCSSCKIKRKLYFLAKDQLVSAEMTFCNLCVTEATQLDALEVARDEFVRADTATWSEGYAQTKMPLAPRIFLAFNDFALAGPRFPAASQPLIDTLPLPPAFAPHVHAWHFGGAEDTDAVAFVIVDSAAVAAAAYWALADALLTLLSDVSVQELVVVAALHLPYAKQAAVYHASLNAGGERTDARFPPVDAAWELKDRFLAALVHLLKVEQAPRAHFLLAKGHKPGRDHAGTY